MRVHSALFLVSLLYAILFSWAGEIMPSYISAEGFVWLRILTAFTLFSICSLFITDKAIDWRNDWKRFALCAFFGTAANMFMFFKGLSMTKPINGAVLMLVTPLFVAIIEHWVQKKTPSISMTAGISIGALGAFLLMWGKGAQFSSETLEGDIWVSVNALFYAIYLVLAKKLANKYHAITVNRVMFGMGLIYIAPLGAIPLWNTQFTAIPGDIWLKIGYILFFTSFLVYLLNTYGIKHASGSLVGIYIYLQPLLATVIAMLLGRDQLTPEKAMYALMIIIGVWLVSGKYNLKMSPSIKRG
ncbi:MAG: DMT family transporter [Bacteroidetes bacterium]|nr:DMT family transporter [Bacteroidota bacterium]